MRFLITVSALLFTAALSSPVCALEAPDNPQPRPSTDRVTRYQLWAMHQDGALRPPYRFNLVDAQPPMIGTACFRRLRAMFDQATTGQQHDVQIPMLLNWLAVHPDPPPDYAKWLGCFPSGAPYYTAWQQHLLVSGGSEATNYWYKPWRKAEKPQSAEACLALIRTVTGLRHPLLLRWYAVHPDPLPDVSKSLGCLPSGYDPEEPTK